MWDMTTKKAIIATMCTGILALVLGIAALFLFVDFNAPNAEQRAASLGQGMAVVCAIPLAIIWIMWADRFRKDRERKQRSPRTKR